MTMNTGTQQLLALLALLLAIQEASAIPATPVSGGSKNIKVTKPKPRVSLPSGSSRPDSSNSRTRTAAIIGGVIGILVLGGLLAAYLIWKKKKAVKDDVAVRKKLVDDDEHEEGVGRGEGKLKRGSRDMDDDTVYHGWDGMRH
ncbi:hypothetical protein BZA05DRAFT_422562 [Tricharina praecox]|uniref:uncharacterized protein n=1 Tax=Tricharina praecox TaxID=43433 RepID=UPI00222097FC|nr:uncharacterized protein BZA05DRAFT_422562 [Tricharina praecox]KAI5842332.1 hypothetical protein BZA05DRAFT_422562 [Tricharina praecox]